MATATPSARGGPDAAEQYAGLLELNTQLSAASIRPPRERSAEGLCPGVASSHSQISAHLG